MSKKVRNIAKKVIFPLENLPESVQNIAYPVIGSVVGGPIGGAVAGGLNNYQQTGDLKSSLLSAGGSYIGGNIGGAIGGPTVGSSLSTALGPDLGSVLGQNIGSLASTPLNAIIGSQVGANLASSLVPQKTASPQGANPTTAFKASREKEAAVPASFSSYGGSLTPNQLSTNIATGGVYGGGAGPEESDYFMNMINRRLVTDEGQVDSDLSEVLPIESSFLAQMGLGGYNNANDLLEAISRRRAA